METSSLIIWSYSLDSRIKGRNRHLGKHGFGSLLNSTNEVNNTLQKSLDNIPFRKTLISFVDYASFCNDPHGGSPVKICFFSHHQEGTVLFVDFNSHLIIYQQLKYNQKYFHVLVHV